MPVPLLAPWGTWPDKYSIPNTEQSLCTLLIAVTHPTRLPGLSTTPTLRELGFPAAESVAYAGIVAPSGTPDDIITKLNAAFNQAMKQTDVKQGFERLNVPAIGGTPQAFTNLIRAETERWVPLIRRLGLKAE